MTSLETLVAFDSTSAAGAMRKRLGREPMLVGMMLVGLGTSTAPALPVEFVSYSGHRFQQTSAGSAVSRPESAGAAIAKLRRLSGLTWEQCARLFDVSRRSLHFWASGKAMTPANAEHLEHLLLVVRAIDRGSARANRAELLAIRDDGTTLLDELARREYDRVLALLGPGEAKRTLAPRISAEAVARRLPQPPDELVDALQDRVHRETGVARAAKSVRVRGDV